MLVVNDVLLFHVIIDHKTKQQLSGFSNCIYQYIVHCSVMMSMITVLVHQHSQQTVVRFSLLCGLSRSNEDVACRVPSRADDPGS